MLVEITLTPRLIVLKTKLKKLFSVKRLFEQLQKLKLKRFLKQLYAITLLIRVEVISVHPPITRGTSILAYMKVNFKVCLHEILL